MSRHLTPVELAEGISDGRPVDWVAAESGPGSERESGLIRELRVLADVAQLHATLHSSRTASPAVHDSILHPSGTPPQAADSNGESDALVQWGPLNVLEKVGRGTYGDVYRAWDTRLDREVALKLLRRRDEGDALGSSVIEEGRLQARVRHPGVVTIYGADRIESRVGLWMEFMHGPTLEQELRRRGPFDAAEAAQVGIDLCQALSAVHGEGLLHRDVKAQNVMRDETGRLALGDFGPGRELDEAGDGTSGEVAGTPLYLAPEIFERTQATVQSDI